MAQQTVNLGTVANDGTGDPLRDAFDKCNDNFSELYGSSTALITETVTAGSAANVTFSSIPGTYRDLLIRVRGRGDGAVFSQNVQVQFNADTGNNYHWNVEQGQGGTNVVAQTLAASSAVIGLFNGASAVANYAGVVEAIIGDYRGTTFFKPVSSRNATSVNNAVASIVSGTYGGIWLSTSAITSVKVFLSTGNFVNGSVVSLYGCK